MEGGCDPGTVSQLQAKVLSIPPALAVSDKWASGFSHRDYMKMQRKGAKRGSKLLFPLFYKSSEKNPKGANSTLEQPVKDCCISVLRYDVSMFL